MGADDEGPGGDPPWQPRDDETAALRRLLTAAAAGRGGALLVHGEAGVGKTALVERVVARAPGVRVLSCRGVEFEMGLDHATLHQLCAPVLADRAALPDPARRALEGAFGHRDAPADPLLVGLAVVGLLSESAVPVVCVVDDAQWADPASLQALAFVARRVSDERVALVFTAREPDVVTVLADVPRLPLRGLDAPRARALLTAAHVAPMDSDVARRILAEARGNPLALVELARHETAPDLVGDPGDLSPVRAVERGFARRLDRLPPRGRDLVTLAAAEPLGDPALLARAAGLRGLSWADAREAEDDGLLVLDAHVRFRHPLVRSAAYRLATPAQRRTAHAALAEATDAERDPDRRAWHRASAADVPDEAVAALLESSADRARDRGGNATAGAFLARAAELTPDPLRMPGRTVAAARLYQRAGDWASALALVERLPAASLTPGQATEAALLRAQIRFQQDRSVEAVEEMLALAGRLDVDRARETYLEAFSLTRFVDRAPGGRVRTATAIAASTPAREPPRPVDRILDALLAQATSDGGDAVPAMRRAVDAVRAMPDGEQADPRLREHACQLALDLGDDDAAVEIADRQAELARRSGALAVLSLALKFQTLTRVLTGRFDEAAACGAEAAAVDDAMRGAAVPFGEVVLAAWRGDLDGTVALAERIEPPGSGPSKVATVYALTVAHNGAGRYDRAADLALAAFAHERRGLYQTWALLPELVEAASRAGRAAEARDALDLLAARARAIGTDRARAMAAYAAALLDDRPDENHRTAVDLLRGTSSRAYLARALLGHGEFSRRAGHRADARRLLREAHDLFTAMGAAGFARRAERELEATGEHPRPRAEDAPQDRLTAQEVHIARRVSEGATTKEVAAALFLSPRTVDAHLRSIFRKLGLASRRQLRGMTL